MPPSLLRLSRRLLWFALLPLSLLAGCRLYEAPIYQHLAPHARVQKILFIGNSLTFYNDLPGLLEQLSAREDQPLLQDNVTFANASLAFHWNFTAARRHLDQGGWAFVVLQEYSTRPASDPAATLRDYRLWGPAVTALGARPILFENWPHQGQESDAPTMHATYLQAQKEIGGDLAPIGPAFLLCQKEHPEIDLFVDEKHPTVAGTYLAACVLYKTLYHKPAAGLPTSITGLKLSPYLAATLQQIADTTQ